MAPGGGPGYAVSFNADPCTCPNAGNPLPSASNDITTGPFAGFKGLITPYTLTVTARSTGGGSEVRLRREVQTVAVPVFQFGVFGEKSLSFHAGADFDFGGRVHTNGHLFLAEGTGATLTFRDKLTAIGEVVRSELENGNTITASGHTGTVTIPTVIGSSYRNLSASEGSVIGGPASGPVTGWKNLSEVTYATNVRNTLTGAKRLDLPLVSQGARPIDLIRRPPLGVNEFATNPPVFGQRYFALASLRILLSDRAADMTGLSTITATAPVALDGTFVPPGGMPPVARSIGPRQRHRRPATGGTGRPAPEPSRSTAVSRTGCAWGTTSRRRRSPSARSTVTNCNRDDSHADSGLHGRRRHDSAQHELQRDDRDRRNAHIPNRQRRLGDGRHEQDHHARLHAEPGAGDTPHLRGQHAAHVLGLQHAQQISSPAATGRLRRRSTPSTSHTRSPMPGRACSAASSRSRSRTAAGAWSDVTTEILNLGFSAPNQEGTSAPAPIRRRMR